MNAITVLSPHFDDGVLSCGGEIWEATHRGHAVRVITLFSGPPPRVLPPFAAVQHRKWGAPPLPNALRQAEDRAAYLRLGCTDVCYLDVPDAVYRISATGEPRYGTEAAIFGEVHRAEQQQPTTLADRLSSLLLPGGTVLAPAGVGGHVDHQLARAVGDLLAREGITVAYYEELPYVERSPTDDWGDDWVQERVPVSEAAVTAKIAAIAYYHTQIPVLYGSIEEMERRIRAIAAAASAGAGYAEPRWWRKDG